jgi:hypothetical protein
MTFTKRTTTSAGANVAITMATKTTIATSKNNHNIGTG